MTRPLDGPDDDTVAECDTGAFELDNVAPTDIALSNDSIAENSELETTVGTLSTTDANGGTHTYTLVSGTGSTDNGSFKIGGVNGDELQTDTELDYETKSSYTIRVRSTDSGNLFFEEEFTITVTDVNEAPAVVVSGGACLSDTDAMGSVNLTVSDPETAAGSLTLTASSSNTTLVPNANLVLGGSGANRTLTLSAAARKTGTAVVTVNVSDGVNTTALPITVKIGSLKNETLNGTSGPDMLFGLGGKNTLSGLGGNDLLCGGNGVDTLSGGDGADVIDGGRGNDMLNGGNQNDTLFANGGDDTLTGGAGADAFNGGSGIDTATDFNAGQGDTQTGIP